MSRVRKESKFFHYSLAADERYISIGFLSVALLGINQAFGIVDALLDWQAA